MHLPIDIRRLGARKLAADYGDHFASLAPFFSGDPASADAWRSAIARAQAHPRARAEMAALVTSQLERRGAPEDARAAAARLADPRTVAIVTGQQAGLFGGPLYTLYKALTAVRLAGQIARDHDVPAVAVFWVESEDHDWAEVASASVLDADLQRRTITLPAPADAGHLPIGRIPLGREITTAIDELARALPHTDFTDALVNDLRDAYAPGVSLGEGFARWLDRLVGPLGMIVFDCADAAAKPLAAGIFARELAEPGRTRALADAAGQRLVSSGYHAQVDGSDHTTAALFHIDGARRPVAAADAARLVEEVERHPEAFSPNVLLRPIVQDQILPTAGYVSGPNELAYLAQLGEVYEQFGVPRPLFYPRASATILDAASARFLEKHGLPFEALQARDESALNRLLAATLPEHIDRALADADAAVAEKMAVLIAAMPALDPTLEAAARSTLGKLQHDLSGLRHKIISAAKKRDETLRRQFTRAQAQAFPDGELQERGIGSAGFLNRYGPVFVDALLRELPLDIGRHWVLTL